jgi:D-beta-D-heptose 7-phosphate kinase / D-beta-D-heptose 1-phosphate adenosyltransferase
MSSLLQHLRHWKPFKAVVVGDFMLDQLVFGDAERLSADAPVPILQVQRTESRPGGAANVCLDLAALQGSVTAIGVVGNDPTAHTLRTSLQSQGIDTAGLIADHARPTTLKQNLIGLAQARHPQKMFRVDYESTDPISPEIVEKLLHALDSALPHAHVVCIEDYNKGVCSPAFCHQVIERATRAKVPVMIDPARLSDYRKYSGATVITPNRTEAEVATGLKTHGDASIEHNTPIARRLLDTLDLDAVVMTLDRHGALFLHRGEPAVSIPTIAREVYDVTGAGDMFLAALAASRANGLPWDDSVRFANAAAGLEVEIFGVEPIPFERIHHSLLLQTQSDQGKLRTQDDLLLEVAALRKQGKRIVFTNGCFDVLHAGHIALLQQAAAFGDFLIVAINTDDSVRALKGPTRPVNIEHDRARVLGALESVGAVVFFADQTPLQLITALKPDVLVKGADYSKDKVVGADVVEAAGGRVELVNLVEGKSTTATIARMKTT